MMLNTPLLSMVQRLPSTAVTVADMSKAGMPISPQDTKAGCDSPTSPPSNDEAAAAPAPAPAGSANFAGLTTLPEGIDPNSIPVVDSLPGSGGSRVSFADQVPVPAGHAPVQFDPANYALQPCLNLAAALDAEDKTDWTFLSMLGLNM